MARTGEIQGAAAPPDIGILAPTLEAIRTNCHISDARHATRYTLCVYLLKMREYFRWEHRLPFGTALPHDELTNWLTKREQHWESLEDTDFLRIPVGTDEFDPFDSEAINAVINPLGFIYSGGYGQGMKPVFFMGRLEQQQQRQQYNLMVSGQELARDLAAPPAMSVARTIYIRRESLRRMLWERIEEWRWNKPDNAMKQAIACYDFSTNADAALEAMTDNELQTVLLHEVGEVRAGELLGPEWESMLSGLGHCKAEIMLRAVRDHLSDALSTLPGLLEDPEPAGIYGYFAGLSNMRKELFPALMDACASWSENGDITPISRLIDPAVTHWTQLALQSLALFHTCTTGFEERVTRLIESTPLRAHYS